MKIVKFDEVDSTQAYIKNILKDSDEEIAVCAICQNSGRGRRGNVWASPRGGLWFSLFRKMPDNIKEVYTLGIGIAVLLALKDVYGDIPLKLKWPNDILVNGKKVCGIICEAIYDKVVIGIGVNTNFDRDFLGELKKVSDTLKSITGKVINNDDLMQKIIDNISVIENYTKDTIINIFRDNMGLIGENRYITALEKEAIIIGIDNDGRLIVEYNGNQEKIIGGNILNT